MRRGTAVHPSVRADEMPTGQKHSERREVVTYAVGNSGAPDGHEACTRAEIARRLAAVARFGYAGEYVPGGRYDARPYFVPSNTLTRADAASLHIDDAGDLFGGVVPAAFAATKTITHPLVDDGALAPRGWSTEFPHQVADSVLPGYSAFTAEDARRAGRMLLENGPVRVKLATGVAGIGQWTAHDAAELDAVIAAIDSDNIEAGVVVEQNLTTVKTQSVGQIRVAGVTASYCGTQHLTINNSGIEVYGGSALRVVRGGFERLLALDLPADLRLAITQARTYDHSATVCFSGFFASRRNYDVAQGVDAARNPPLGRARAIVATGRRERRGDRRPGSVLRRFLAALGARRLTRSVRRRRIHPARSDGVLSRHGSESRRPFQVHAGRSPCRRAMSLSTSASRTSTSSAR